MKHLFRLSLLLLTLLLPATALAHDFEVDGIYYNINGNEATVTYLGSYGSEYDEYTGDVTIPETVTYNGRIYPVTAIGNAAFSGCGGLTSVTIPNSVTFIGDVTFSNCSSLSSIKVASGNSTYDSRGNCNAIIETATNTLVVGCKNSIVLNSITSIGNSAFSYCTGLTSITIPNSVTSIGDSAFQGCSDLVTITIGNSVTTIGNYAFGESRNLASIVIPNSVIIIGDEAFYDCCGLTDVTIGESVSLIGQFAFCGCSGLTSITIPNSVTEINFGTFGFCTSLASISIPNSVTYIGPGAFSYCTGLISITIPNSVTSIGFEAFSDCYRLTEIYSLALTPPTIDSNTFNSCYGATLNVPKEAVNEYKAADYWKNFTNIVGVIFLGYTFNVDGIYYRVMSDDAASVIANEDVESYYTAEVVIPDSVTYEEQTYAVTGIEDNAFDGCYELTSITIPYSVETIGEQAFQGCTGLTSVTIGSGVTAIGAKAFNYCNALETVKCIRSMPPVMASTDCFTTTAYNRATLLVPRQFVDAYQSADYWYKFAHIDDWGSAGQGDVNGDGVMNITDVTSLIDVLLGHELDSFYFESADLNINGRLDIGDVTSLIDNLLNGDY